MSSIVILSKNFNFIKEFQSNFGRFIDYIKAFHTQSEAEDYIRKWEDYLIIFIVSLEFDETVIKHIHDLRQLHQIYVYNPANVTDLWTKSYKKLLIKTGKENDDREPLIQYFRSHAEYTESEQVENAIKFVREWSPGTSITSYTQDSFVYRILNKAFRSRNFEFLILFRFFISDLHQQLSDRNINKMISTETIYYRGQLMYKSELESLEEKQLICSLGFFSATREKELALHFYAGAKSYSLIDELQSVLFTIKLSSSKYKQLIFSDISPVSHFGIAEQEILFTVGSYFEISRIQFDNDLSTWIIELTEGYVQETMNKSKKPFDVEIISIGFYLFVLNDNFRFAERFYKTLLCISNSLSWIIACHVGFGLIEYFKEKYQSALNKFKEGLEIIDKENVYDTCRIIGNIHCLIGNVYREMKYYDEALNSYNMAIKNYPVKFYFIQEKDQYWTMHNYTKKLNSFLKNDKYFYYCDRPLLNKVITYKITEQWDLAVDIFKNLLNDTRECSKTGSIKMFVKLLGFSSENDNISNINVNNHTFLGDKTYSNFLDENFKSWILHAYIELGNHYIEHNYLDYAFICYQEIMQCETEIESFMNVEHYYGIGRVYELKEDYIKSIDYFKKAIDYTVTNIVNTVYSTNIFHYVIYEKFLFISNKKLNDKSSSILYMKEIIDTLIQNTNHLDKINDLVAKIYKITVLYYNNDGDGNMIESICNHIIEVLDKINLNDQGWKKWICIGSKCTLKIFDTLHYHCQPIVDNNYSGYLKLYEKLLDIISQKQSSKYEYEIGQCNYFISCLKVKYFDQQLALLQNDHTMG
ncbi:unnamed protein product [Rotaria sordida]|uniref:Tetratricopeptide repeat protein n=1 Tax=Rotaria sordida TaxID=392033 RepID=A0A814GR02_9BILA|nr:unnamed protein product [Rotaria sordida]CAF1581189.1 unnamed protein product [Rotaria sordida]